MSAMDDPPSNAGLQKTGVHTDLSFTEGSDDSDSRRPSKRSSASPRDRLPTTMSFTSEMREYLGLRQEYSRRTITANFFERTTGNESDHDSSKAQGEEGVTYRIQQLRILTEACLESYYMDLLLGMIVAADCLVMVLETDTRAANRSIPTWMDALSYTWFSIYTLEFVARIFVKGCSALKDAWTVFDLSILLSGSVEIVMAILGYTVSSFGFLRIFRVARTLRVLKLIRKFRSLKELRRMAEMAVSCVKTLIWAFVFSGMITSIWAFILVEMVHPLMDTIADQNTWEACPDCRDSFSSVLRANLTLFKTVVASDSWGLLAVPLIEEHPWTAIIFIGSHLTLIYGVLNLVLAVVVDTFAEIRQKNVMALAKEMEDEMDDDIRFLNSVFKQIDTDSSGALSWEEIMTGASAIPEFQSRLRVMDIDQNDLEQLFYMLDRDGSGTVDSNEFVGALSRWLLESKSAMRFVKHNVDKLVDQQSSVVKKLDTMHHRLHGISSRLRGLEDTSKSKQKKKKRQLSRSASKESGGSVQSGSSYASSCASGNSDVGSIGSCRNASDSGGGSRIALHNDQIWQSVEDQMRQVMADSMHRAMGVFQEVQKSILTATKKEISSAVAGNIGQTMWDASVHTEGLHAAAAMSPTARSLNIEAPKFNASTSAAVDYQQGDEEATLELRAVV
eukprot:TRINITY_DN18638_c0_g1_i5.p1 TRINITY_DN18638_c0_g1~~TRINITY_DN18638_c0_g1_i5.p1  ORF type:complete len:674 (+),score=100.57 TRINITY_DN18638_c0_g1_i5:51-2072(+)